MQAPCVCKTGCLPGLRSKGWHTHNLAAHSRSRQAWKCQSESRGSNRRICCQQQASVSVQEPQTQVSIEIPTRLNNTPHARDTRQWFYQDAVRAMQAALADGVTRMSLRCTIPELNPEMDVYRIGTLLEWVRELATALAQDGKQVKVCVQQSMGQGVFQGLPLSLSGVRRIMSAMDWGDVAQFVGFGEVGRDQVDSAAYYILIAPQNVVGTTILTNLGDMVQEVEQQGKKMVLVNPVLRDIPSAAGVMGVRGRAERMAFTASFDQAYHFRLLYLSHAKLYPIMGAMRHVHGQPWQVYKRIDLGKKEEEYRLIDTFEREPVGLELTACFRKPQQPKPKSDRPYWMDL